MNSGSTLALGYLTGRREEGKQNQGWKNEGKELDWNNLCVVNTPILFSEYVVRLKFSHHSEVIKFRAEGL